MKMNIDIDIATCWKGYYINVCISDNGTLWWRKYKNVNCNETRAEYGSEILD